MAAVKKVVIEIVGDTKGIKSTIKQLEKVGKVDRKNAKSFKQTSGAMSKGFGQLKTKVMALGATMLGAFAIKQVVGNVINTLKTFEKEMSTLQSITGSTAEEMEFFKQASIDVGKATKTSATEVVKAFTLIGSAQPELLKNSEALAEVTKQALILGKAAGIDAASAATALTSAMNQYGASAKDAAKFTDIFATSQQKGSSFIAATSEALKNVGAAASAAGLSFETTNAALQALAKGALVGSEAGTALRGVLIKLSSQADNSINPSMVGLGTTIENLAKRNLTLADATKLVGQEGATGLLTLIKQRDIYFELDGALNEVGNAMAQMEINTDNLDGSLDDLNIAWETFILQLSGSEGILKDTTDIFTDFLTILTERGLLDAFLGFAFSINGMNDRIIESINLEKDAEKAAEARIARIKKLSKVNIDLSVTQKEFNDLTIEAMMAQKDLDKLFKDGKITWEEYGFAGIAINAILKKQITILSEAEAKAANEIRNIFLLKDAISKLTEERGKQGTSIERIAEINKELIPLQAELNKLMGKETKESLKDGDKALQKRIDFLSLFLDEAVKITSKIDAEILAMRALNAKGIEEEEDDIKTGTEFRIAQFQKTMEGRKQALQIQLANEEIDQELFNIKMGKLDKEAADYKIAQQQRAADAIGAISSATLGFLVSLKDRKIQLLDNETTVAIRNLQEQRDQNIITEEDFHLRRDAIEKEADNKRKKLLRERAEAQKAAAIIEAIINTAVAVTNAAKDSIPLAILVGILGAAEIATITAQPIPEFHEGKKPELKDGEMFAKVLKSESVIPPEQSKKYKGAIDSMIDKNFEKYVFQEYMLPMMKGLSNKSDTTAYDDILIWNNQKKQIKLMQENNTLSRTLIKSMELGNRWRSWR